MVTASSPSSHDPAQPPFAFAIDTQRHLLTITKRGYWSMATFEAFAQAFEAHLRQMRAAGGCRYCLVDASAYAVQSADVTRALLALVSSFPPDCPARMAGITGSKLSELQARHAAATSSRQVFANRAAAEAWLFAESR